MSQKKEIPEGQRPDEDLLAYMERVNPEMFESLKYIAESASISNPKQEEISENIRPSPKFVRRTRAYAGWNVPENFESEVFTECREKMN